MNTPDDSNLKLTDTALLTYPHLAQRHQQLEDGQQQVSQQLVKLAVEAAIAIVINDIHYAVLMASPYQLDYLAMGFLFSEGLISQSSDLLDWDILSLSSRPVGHTSATNIDDRAIHLDNRTNQTNVNGEEQLDWSKALANQLADYDVYVIHLVVSQRCHQRILAQRRQLAGRTGCGMCGITGLSQALPDLTAYQRPFMPAPNLDSLLALKDYMDTQQQAHLLTGAVHAAATFYDGDYQLFEDVGRHNALDKLIGWQLRHQASLDYVVMTSRLSIELVQKSIRARLPWLIGMSAPTSTATRVAQRYGLGLAGFLRDNRVTYYAPQKDK
ncbi:MAG: formate dehydrogenase accessory sulfurtransferase FdhD [Psychrobacter sp.]|nr:formate dehydrogenase accessory sulfurtransferase FdhD [Psychrobacter sp.]